MSDSEAVSTPIKRPSRGRRRGGRAGQAAEAARRVAPIERFGTRVNKPYQPLDVESVEQIYTAALNVLAEIGVGNPLPELTELAIRKGATLDARGRLLFPAPLVKDIIAGAAREFVLYGRTPENDFEIAPGHVHYCTGGAAVSMLEHQSGKYRPSVAADIYDAARVCDNLESIHWFARPVVATEIADAKELDLNTVYASLAGTSKHIGCSFFEADSVYATEKMFDLVMGGAGKFRERPCLSIHATCMVSPLTFAEESCLAAKAAIDVGMPVLSQCGPQAGATAPASLAGTLVQTLAEQLGSLVMINLFKPGHPTIMAPYVFVSDLRTGAFSGGSGEQAVLAAAQSQVLNHIGIPNAVAAGMTDSKQLDSQAGFEMGITDLLAGLAGSNMIMESAGMTASLMGCSLESFVLGDEMLKVCRRILRGIEVTEDNLAMSVKAIRDSVNGEGHFLGHEQTIALMQSEFVYPKFFDRNSIDDWVDAGEPDMRDRACNFVTETLAATNPHAIPDEIDSLIRAEFPIKLSRAHILSGQRSTGES